MHNRQAIRDALAIALAGVSATLYVEPRRRVDVESLPAVMVSLGDDEADEDESAMAAAGSTWTVEHRQNVNIEIMGSGVGDTAGRTVADAIDDLEVEIEAAVAADTTLGGICEIIAPAGSTYETNADGETVIAVRTVAYLAIWRAVFGSPDTPET